MPQGQYSGGSGYVDNRFGRAGYLWDPVLEVYHVRHRVYDAADGRWLQPDPIGHAGGWNLYEYGAGDYANTIDPWGLEPSFQWHHSLVQSIEDLVPRNIIDDAAFGRLFLPGEHSNDRTHRQWSSAVREAVSAIPETERTKERLLSVVKDLEKSDEFRDWLRGSKRTTMSYTEWARASPETKMKELERAFGKAAVERAEAARIASAAAKGEVKGLRRATGKAVAKGTVRVIGTVLVLGVVVSFVETAEAQGFVYAAIDTVTYGAVSTVDDVTRTIASWGERAFDQAAFASFLRLARHQTDSEIDALRMAARDYEEYRMRRANDATQRESCPETPK